eukprot:SAG11_NODE_10016_length_862_cov_1.344692_1_plen_213_part_10
MKSNWQKTLQDASNAVYNDSSLTSGYLLKAAALQGLERWEEAVRELEECVNRGPGGQDHAAHEQLQHAQFLLKKSQRPCLYELLGVKNKENGTVCRTPVSRSDGGCHYPRRRSLRHDIMHLPLRAATEKEIRTAYKKAALQYHPDRWGGKPEEEQKAAEAKFKLCADALELLTDPEKNVFEQAGRGLLPVTKRQLCKLALLLRESLRGIQSQY